MVAYCAASMPAAYVSVHEGSDRSLRRTASLARIYRPYHSPACTSAARSASLACGRCCRTYARRAASLSWCGRGVAICARSGASSGLTVVAAINAVCRPPPYHQPASSVSKASAHMLPTSAAFIVCGHIRSNCARRTRRHWDGVGHGGVSPTVAAPPIFRGCMRSLPGTHAACQSDSSRRRRSVVRTHCTRRFISWRCTLVLGWMPL